MTKPERQHLEVLVAAIVSGHIAKGEPAKIATAFKLAQKIIDFDPDAPPKKFDPSKHIR